MTKKQKKHRVWYWLATWDGRPAGVVRGYYRTRAEALAHHPDRTPSPRLRSELRDGPRPAHIDWLTGDPAPPNAPEK